MRSNFYALLVLFSFLPFGKILFAQCPEQALVNGTPAFVCEDAPVNADIISYISECRTICYDNTAAGNSGQVIDLSCLGGNSNNDLYAYINNPSDNIPGYDGSLVFRWVDWPNKDQGVIPPYLAVHAEINALFAGITVQSLDCTDSGMTTTNFAFENAICFDPATPGFQLISPSGTIPTLAELDPIVDQEAGLNLNTNDISYWLQMVTSDGATGNICFEISPYQPGFICDDATNLVLNGNASAVSGSATACLCESAVYGGLQNVANNLPVPCGDEAEGAAWFEIDAPYACNSIDASITSWSGTDDYNVVILKDVDCPGVTQPIGISGMDGYIPGFVLENGASIVGSSCSGNAISDTPLEAGTYYVYVSGKTERATFDLDVTVNSINPDAGTANSPQANGSICSGAPISISSTGSDLPNAISGQTILWYSDTDVSFDPYAAAGNLLGAGSMNVNATLPINLGCTPVIHYIKGIISDDGVNPSANCESITNVLNVTVYPEIGQSTVTNNPCVITVSGRCPNFTVNGNTGSDTYIANFSEDGNTVSFTVSNGLAGCFDTINETISCSGSCTQPIALGQSQCDSNDPFNFYVDVDLTVGSAASYLIVASDGSSFPVSSTGMYTVGPFANGNTVSIEVQNSEDQACNILVGSFTDNCNPSVCSALTSAVATVSGNTCAGSTAILQATVDQGIINQDYSVQWFEDGVAIPGANFLVFNHVLETSQGCNPEVKTLSVELTCLLPDAAPSTQSDLTVSSGLITLFPTPELGVDFIPDPSGCLTAPVDLCGNLTISHSPISNPNPGDTNVQVNYTVSIAGAPAGCSTTGTYTINCYDCTNDAGTTELPADEVICFGDDFMLETSGESLEDGYAFGYAVSTSNPFGNLQTAVNDAVNGSGDILGPFADGSPVSLNNGTDFTGDTYYFTPFIAMDLDNSTAVYVDSGDFNVNVFQNFIETITIPADVIPHCQGLTNYNINLVVNRTSGGSNSIDGVTGLVFYDGGSTANVDLDSLGHPNDPNQATIELDVSNFNIFGGNTLYEWFLTIEYEQAYPFPSICPSCRDEGNAAVYNLLPQIQLNPINVPSICPGDLVDLSALEPVSNIQGQFQWYDGDPTNGGNILPDPTQAQAINGSYWLEFSANDDATCTEVVEVPFLLSSVPAITQIPDPAAICQGDEVDLTSLESSINTNNLPGEFTWFKGDPNQAFAVQLTDLAAASQFPGDGAIYFAQFTASGGCNSSISISYTVNDLPAVGFVPDQVVCAATSINLTVFNATVSLGAAGSISWFVGNPMNGQQIPDPSDFTPSDGDQLFGLFTSSSGCSNASSFSISVNDAPQLTNPGTQTGFCEGDQVDLTQLESQINSNSQTGNFVWYEGSTGTGTLVPNPTVINILDGAVFSAVFTNQDNCSAFVSFDYSVSAQPTLSTVTVNPICETNSIDLTNLESQINDQGFAGTFTWFEGNPLTGFPIADPMNYFPGSPSMICALFTNASGCSAQSCFQLDLNPLPILGSLPQFPSACAGVPFDLTEFESDLLQQNTTTGTGAWYIDNPTMGGTLIADPTALMINPGDQYFFQFISDAGCSNVIDFPINDLPPISGVQAFYDCSADTLAVDLTNVMGGSFMGGYFVSMNSANQPGQTLPEGSSWSIQVEDSEGCFSDVVSGTVDCIQCSPGVADPIQNNVLCCSDDANLTLSGANTADGNVIAWAVSPFSDGPVSDDASLQVAADAGLVFLGNESDNSFLFNRNCSQGAGTLANGEYYFTPVLVEDPEIDSILYDTMSNCIPTAIISPTFSSPTPELWALQPMIINRPDGSIYNINDSLAFGLPINQALIDVIGGLPPFDLFSLYDGDPNGSWGISFTNIGTGEFSFDVPDFLSIVEADSCDLIETDQVIQIPGFTGTVQAGETFTVNFQIPPPPADFPTVNSDCGGFGTAVILDLRDDTSGPPCTVPIEEIEVLEQFDVFPNPFNDQVRIELTSMVNTNALIRVYDMIGQEIQHESWNLLEGENEKTLSLGNLPGGVYLIALEINQEIIYRKVVKE